MDQVHPDKALIKAHQVGTEAHGNVADLIRVGLNQLLQDTSQVIILCFLDHNKQLCREEHTITNLAYSNTLKIILV